MKNITSATTRSMGSARIPDPPHRLLATGQVVASPETRLVVYTPMTDADASALAELTKAPPEIALCPHHAAIKAAASA